MSRYTNTRRRRKKPCGDPLLLLQAVQSGEYKLKTLARTTALCIGLPWERLLMSLYGFFFFLGSLLEEDSEKIEQLIEERRKPGSGVATMSQNKSSRRASRSWTLKEKKPMLWTRATPLAMRGFEHEREHQAESERRKDSMLTHPMRNTCSSTARKLRAAIIQVDLQLTAGCPTTKLERIWPR